MSESTSPGVGGNEHLRSVLQSFQVAFSQTGITGDRSVSAACDDTLGLEITFPCSPSALNEHKPYTMSPGGNCWKSQPAQVTALDRLVSA